MHRTALESYDTAITKNRRGRFFVDNSFLRLHAGIIEETFRYTF